MSPEQQGASPEKPKKEYELIADKLIADIQKLPPEESVRADTAVKDFLMDIVDRAEAGEISSKALGGAYTRETLMAQFEKFSIEKADNMPDPTGVIPGFHGMRTAFLQLDGNPATKDILSRAVSELVAANKAPNPNAGTGKPDIFAAAPSVAADMLNDIDRHTEAMANAEREPRITEEEIREVGEEALDDAGVPKPGEAPNPWSREAAEEKRATGDYLFDDGDVKHMTTTMINGQAVRAITVGRFTDSQGVLQALLGPVSAEDAKLFEGRRVTKSFGDILSPTSANRLSKRLQENHEAALAIPKAEVPEHDGFGDAMPIEDFNKLMAQRRAEAHVEPTTPEQTPPTPETETEAEMYARFAREYRAEKSDLYAQLRAEESKISPNANKVARLQREIGYAKDGEQKNDRLAAQARGITNYT